VTQTTFSQLSSFSGNKYNYINQLSWFTCDNHSYPQVIEIDLHSSMAMTTTAYKSVVIYL